MDEDAPKLQVRLVGCDGRCRYDTASKDRLVATCLQPGVSVSRLALEHGVNANLVRKWVKRAREERALPAVSAFVPVQIASDICSSADSDVKPAGIPIKDRPPFRFEAGHDSNQRSAGFRH
jgi:transposase